MSLSPPLAAAIIIQAIWETFTDKIGPYITTKLDGNLHWSEPSAVLDQEMIT